MVAAELLDTLHDEDDQDSSDVQQAWRDEVLQRIGEIERGEVHLESWDEVRNRIRRVLGSR